MACEIKDPTNNPICSDSLQDLKNNTIIMDQYINSEEFEVPDRLGIPRKTWAGLEKDVQYALANLDPKVEQLIADKIIAQGGVEIVDSYGNSKSKVVSQDFTTNNSSRIKTTIGVNNTQEFEEILTSQVVTVVGNPESDTTDLGNYYINGNIKYNGYDFNPMFAQSAMSNQARYNFFGGQLSKLKDALCNPFYQKFGVNFFGDSNMWGSGTRQNAPTDPRTGGLSDARDHFLSNSAVNLFKRFIGKKYFNNATPSLSNYPTSPSGQSIATYKKSTLVFPYNGLNGVEYIPSTPSGRIVLAQQRVGTITDYRASFQYDADKDIQASIEFDFTGDNFDIYYTKTLQGCILQIYVNGAIVAEVDSYSAQTTLQNKLNISFDFVKDAKVTMITNIESALSPNPTNFYLEGIMIHKEVVIQNNGIIGSYAGMYNRFNTDNAISDFDLFTFIQFGGNDRNASVTYGARCISSYLNNLKLMIEKLKSKSVNPILMGTSIGIDRAEQMFTRQDAANSTMSLAKEYNIDFIDNYSVLNGSTISSLTHDGTHLSVTGNAIVARNIITALESSQC